MKRYDPVPFLRAHAPIADRPSILLYTLWRSGTHWLSEMLSDLTGLPSLYDSDDSGNYNQETLDQVEAYDRGTILIRHISISPQHLIPHAASREMKVILLYRDPRDAIASNVNMRKYCEGYRPGLPPFPDMSMPEILDWELANLGDVYRSLLAEWAATTHPMLFKVRYEDLRTDTLATLAHVLCFLDCQADESDIRAVAARHDFQRRTRRRPGVERKDAHRRKGIVGDFRNQFSEEEQSRLNELLRPALVPMGYAT